MKTDSELKIRITLQQEYDESPDSWGDEDLFLVYDHRDFYVNRKGFDPRAIFDEMSETAAAQYEGFHVFTVYAYIHSGVALSLGRDRYPFNDRWDVSSTGFALVRMEETPDREEARKRAWSLIKHWNTYLSGDMKGYEIIDDDENVLESCYGYYDEDALKHDSEHALISCLSQQYEQFMQEMEGVEALEIY